MTLIAEKLPVELVSEFMEKSIPVDVEGLAASLNLIIQKDRRLTSDISGKIACDEDGNYIITVNPSHSPKRQRFTIAHEIAHFILHRDLIGDGIVDDAMYRSESMSSAYERQANHYAAQILLPAPAVRQYWSEAGADLAGLADTFRVSEAVAEIRLKELGLT